MNILHSFIQGRKPNYCRRSVIFSAPKRGVVIFPMPIRLDEGMKTALRNFIVETSSKNIETFAQEFIELRVNFSR